MIVENWKSRSISASPQKSAILNFDIVGSDDALVAEAEMLLAIPATYDSLPKHSHTLEWIAQGIYHAEVTYKLETNPQDQQTPGNVGSTTGQVSLTIGGETVRRTTSDSTTIYGGGPSYDNAIGVSLDGGQWNVEGCEVLVPTMQYRETHYFAPASLTQAYRKTVTELCGSVNNATWKTFAAGSVRFDGAEFSLSNGELIVATYTFSIRKNETSLTIGGIGGVAKKGWQYLWVKYKSAVDSGKPVTEAEAVYVETVYPDGNFSTLQIGT